jgi:phage-related protein
MTTYATNPASLIIAGGFGPYSVHVRNKYGYGVPVGSAPARVTYIGLEVLHAGNSQARVTYIGIEVLRSVTNAGVVPFKARLKPWTLKKKHRRPVYTVKAKLSFEPLPAQVNRAPFIRPLPPWKRGYSMRHHGPQYTTVQTSIFQYAVHSPPTHRKRRPWEMHREHARPQYTTVAEYPWRASPVRIDYVVREALSALEPGVYVSYVARETLSQLSPATKITYLTREALTEVIPPVRVTYVVRETQTLNYSNMEVTYVAREAQHSGPADTRITHVYRETLRATEPFPPPDQQSPAIDTPIVNAARFGDGYTQRAAEGLGERRRKQTLSWVNVPGSQADRILAFLERMNGSYPFMWTPNGEHTPRWFIASAWKVKELNRGYSTIYDVELEEATKEQIHAYNYEPPWLPEAYN